MQVSKYTRMSSYLIKIFIRWTNFNEKFDRYTDPFFVSDYVVLHLELLMLHRLRRHATRSHTTSHHAGSNQGF